MTRRLVQILAVAVLLIVAVDLVVRVRASALPDPPRWSAPEIDYKEKQVRRLQSRGGSSTVLLGSSVIDVGADPAQLSAASAERPAYNAGFGAASIRMIDTWGTRVVLPRLHPDVVVLGLASRDVNANDPDQARFERDFAGCRAVRQLTNRDSGLDHAERRLESWSALFKYRTLLRHWRFIANVVGVGHAPRRDTRSKTTNDRGQYLGFLRLNNVRSPRIDQYFAGSALSRYEIGPRQLGALRHLLAASRRHAHVLVVKMPVTAHYVTLHPRGRADDDEFAQTLRREAAAVGGTFLDLGVWPDAQFADPAHLNGVGAERFSNLIATEIRQLPGP